MPTIEAIIKALKLTMENIDDVKLHFKLKQYHARFMHLQNPTLKACIALDQFGLMITTNIVSTLTNRDLQNVHKTLHCLGDKHLLVLKRKRRLRYEWLLHPTFKALLLESEK